MLLLTLLGHSSASVFRSPRQEAKLKIIFLGDLFSSPCGGALLWFPMIFKSILQVATVVPRLWGEAPSADKGFELVWRFREPGACLKRTVRDKAAATCSRSLQAGKSTAAGSLVSVSPVMSAGSE